MREFMDYIQSSFYAATGWNRDNSYSSLNATADALLNFPTPRGLRLTLGSLATPQFATAYQLGTIGVVDGSVSYLYSSVSLTNAIAQSNRIPLPDLLRSYKPLAELSRGSTGSGNWIRGWDRVEKDALAYGRLYLPRSMLEALVVKRFTPDLQVQVSAVSGQTLRNGGTMLGMVQYDVGHYGIEGLASSDGGLMGMRGLYNFGGDVAKLQPKPLSTDDGGPVSVSGSGNGNGNGNGEREGIYGRFSAGAELYYGTLNKSGGMSVGMRFATLPTYRGSPLTATMTINPLMGNISWSYAVMAGKHCSLASRMDFNVYSYESDWVIGMELWRKKGARASGIDENALTPTQSSPSRMARSVQAKLEWRLDDPLPSMDGPAPEVEVIPAPTIVTEPTEPAEPVERLGAGITSKKERSFRSKLEWRPDSADDELVARTGNEDDEEYSAVLKARLDQNLKIGLLWEGRVQSLLFSLGSGVDLRRLDSPFRSLGLEVQFSS
ncbi:mitochondrial inheritance component MDM10 [Seiridium cupressi]